ncbi:hypothetical protein [Methanococcoides burtonii]|uniref:ATP F0F1 synthase synthase n=1 Tax=Methanococcoides burtonii (strain DSM 6242 / NBRC 107633 / OCM 468 / ACE-M) TaxID=259564 RepID=Q12WN8_METBU|nr:hypothetical protein [Methanococcoides burtonii]ABE52138.1 Hypothetical protein Mbur_1216 [Methanococcoides burtonii DSM 6242]
MNHLLAKTKDRNAGFFKVMSDKRGVFDMPDFSDSQAYSPSYKLEDGEWYKLDKFLSRGYENILIGKTFNSTDYNQITEQQYSKINYLCSKQGDFYLFQKMSPTRLLNKKWFYISGAPKLEIDKPIIILNSFVDAVYDINGDSLYFRNIATVKSMFKGIEVLYREATQAEVDAFLEHGFISLEETFTSNNVKTANRKRIAMVIDTINQFTQDDKQQIFQYIRSYCEDVPVDGDTFFVSTEDHLKKILYGIEQRYYTTPLGNEKRLANSILKLPND